MLRDFRVSWPLGSDALPLRPWLSPAYRWSFWTALTHRPWLRSTAPCSTGVSNAPTHDSCFIRADYGDAIGFQRVENYQAPQWPGQDLPQQMHIDVAVDDLDVAEAAVLELGATKHEHQPGTTFRVFLDPAGHPFCLCAS